MNSIRTAARRLLATAALAGIGAGAALATAAAPAHAWTGCEGDCITSAKFTQWVDGKVQLNMEVKTSVGAHLKLKITTVGGSVAHTQEGFEGFRTIQPMVTPYVLNQGVGYVAALTATDQNGKSYTELINLQPISRTVKVTFGKLRITEDSDVGAGEIKAGAKLGGTTITLFGQRSITATYEKSLGTVMTAKNVPSFAKVYVELVDDDVDGGEFCSSGTGFGFNSGSNSCYDWTTGAVSIGSLPQGKGSTTTRTLYAAGSGKLKFNQTVTITATVG